MGSIASAPAEERLERLGVDERRALIDRIAASAQFRRSARLREFLLYVGGQSLKDGCPDIHEQEIGAKVFGRSSTYDRSQDNIVRVTATELRKRIELYFASEGAHETCSLPSAALQTPQIWASILPVSRQTLVGTSPWTLNFVRPYPEFTPWAIATGKGASPTRHTTTSRSSLQTFWKTISGVSRIGYRAMRCTATRRSLGSV
jgi:hypothetical protein